MRYRLAIGGMSCAGCVAAVEKLLRNVDGVTSATVNFAEHVAVVEADVAIQQLIDVVSKGGYEAAELKSLQQEQQERELYEQRHYLVLRRRAVVAVVWGSLIMLAMWLQWLPMLQQPLGQLWWGVVGLVTLAVMYYSGGHFFRGAWQQLKLRNSNMDTLIAMGTGAAWIYSMLLVVAPQVIPAVSQYTYFEAAVMIMAFINIGNALEIRARGRTSAAIKRLIGLQPKTARVVRDGKEIDIDVDEVGLDETLRVRPGEKIAVDGVVIEGESYVDVSMVTGEPIPQHVVAQSRVTAGTINGQGSFLFRSDHIGKDTLLARIIELVRQAQGSKPRIGRIADQVAAIFVPVVVVIALCSAALWWTVGPDLASGYAIVVLMTVLLIACPCALGLATPIAIMVGVGRAAELGVLIRNGEALQRAGEVTTVVVDKTGTLTVGKPQLLQVIACAGLDEQQIITMAAAVERGSEHPLAQAIISYAEQQGYSNTEASSFHAQIGMGVSAQVIQQTVLLGNGNWMAQHQVDCSAVAATIDSLASEAKIPLCMAVDGQLVAVLVVADAILPHAAKAIANLHGLGLEVVMVSGDLQATADAVAAELQIDSVYAGVLPDGKAAIVQQLQQQGRIVAMVGDGINDAPALAQADVGFAMSGGTDVAMESADVTLIGGDIQGVINAISLSKATLRNIKQNLFGAFFYNALAIPVAAGALYPLWGLLLHPMVAGAAMAASSVTVVTNANRLRLFTPKR